MPHAALTDSDSECKNNIEDGSVKEKSPNSVYQVFQKGQWFVCLVQHGPPYGGTFLSEITLYKYTQASMTGEGVLVLNVGWCCVDCC